MKTAFFFFLLLGSSLWAAPPHITAVAFAPNGQSVVVGSQAGIQVRRWPDLEIERKLGTRLAHVNDLSFSPDGSRLAAVGGSPGESGDVEVFDWPNGKLVERKDLHDDLIYAIAWRSDAEARATASGDRSVYLHDEAGVRLMGHSRGVLAVEYLADGKLIVTGSIDQSVRVWDATTGKLRLTLDNHTAAVRDLALRPATEGLPMIASAGADRTIRFWQPTIGRMVRFAKLSSEPLEIAWTPDGTRIVASCVDGRVRIINADTVKITAEVDAIDGWAYSLAVSPDGTHALVGGANGQLCAIAIPQSNPKR